MKNIEPGQYWRIKYKKYKDVVLVKEKSPYEPGFSCVVSKESEKPYINYLSGELFIEKDFVKQTTKKDFFLSRAKFLGAEMEKCLKIARKCKS